MTKKVSPFKQYLKSSKSIHYSLVVILPLLFIYEIGVFILFRDSFYEMRNTGEVLLRSFFAGINLNNPFIISGILLAIFIAVMIRGYRIEKAPGLHANFIIYMLIESMVWGSILFIGMSLFSDLPLQIMGIEDKLANLNLAVGAGIFEELIFRMVVISAVIVILERGLRQSEMVSGLVAILVSAFVFAAFHLFTEPFTVPVFAQRVVGGVYLGVLYAYRGYGISAYTHIIFNFLILAETW
ncbi:MAG: CPBP family intramembrane metalloprotease [Candidatus Marinimicrobia bacterium]|nr:CPBP family intramembrane metalloprotease [Candidatus Neomarinimicrobiota bacterium]MCF7851418.1 CPBP family intramembrane metalloprotease [Candidatus Neomarinimicrobiota bacterium]MCF7905523.1 CPBP family intramembrane metalloprotease [Candidatus Neomarinimicrobiota bacterium]